MGMRYIKGWRATRRRVISKADGLCQMPICILPSRAGADTVDHIIPRVHGGGHEDSNLRAAHRVCNSRAGGLTQKRASLPMSAPSRW